MILSGGMHPDSKKFLRRDDSQRWSIRNCPDRRFSKQNTRLRLHFKNKTQYRSFISETKHHCIQEQVF